MLKFYDYTISDSIEIPMETSINFHIAECQNRCKNCFSPELWETTNVNLIDVYKNLVLAYSFCVTCVCFLGEGKNTEIEHKEFCQMCDYIHSIGMKTCLYCGRNCNIEPYMNCFDYIKTGAYIPDYGNLSCRTTNQKLLKKSGKGYCDITYLFWDN